jgi:hypothetical protein
MVEADILIAYFVTKSRFAPVYVKRPLTFIRGSLRNKPTFQYGLIPWSGAVLRKEVSALEFVVLSPGEKPENKYGVSSFME